MTDSLAHLPALPAHIAEEDATQERPQPQPAAATASVFGDLWGLTCSITAAYAAGLQQGCESNARL